MQVIFFQTTTQLSNYRLDTPYYVIQKSVSKTRASQQTPANRGMFASNRVEDLFIHCIVLGEGLARTQVYRCLHPCATYRPEPGFWCLPPFLSSLLLWDRNRLWVCRLPLQLGWSEWVSRIYLSAPTVELQAHTEPYLPFYTSSQDLKSDVLVCMADTFIYWSISSSQTLGY